ncbi:MAG TPA: aminotransferase class V-fold PLP-dependent enzyme, partial [Gemmatimonadaceae bacterium]|nr:aminotransferase class V-fold PLP-dependent enzyme [Gemmatimonadaceae bacterium]
RLALVDSVERAITQRTKLLLISHVSAWSGEVLPVKEVTAVARRHGVAVLVDAAQSVGILDVNFNDMGVDFLGTSLHKWLAAPIGTGALIMRPEHIGKVWPLHPPSWDTTEHPMDLYEWMGTFDAAAYNSIGYALDFQSRLGFARKQARLKYLGSYWRDKLARMDRIQILTPDVPDRSFGVAAFAIEGMPSEKVAKHLRDKGGIIVQNKAGRHSPFQNAIRVSPGVYATTRELDRFVTAVKGVVNSGLGA